LKHGIFERFLDVFEGKKKMVVTARNYNFITIWCFNCIEQWQCYSALYLHIVLDFRHEQKQNI